MAVFRSRRFSEPDALKRIDPHRLIYFLRSYETFLSQRGFELPGRSGDLPDYDALSEILMNPDEHMPQELVNALYFINEAATKDMMERLLDETRDQGITLGVSEDAAPADVALAVWQQRPDLLERKSAEQRFLRRRNFECFHGRSVGVATPNLSALNALESDLSAWFAERGRGKWCRVSPYVDGDRTWYLVRHGDPMTREPSIMDGQPNAAYYRPEKFDVLLYHAENGELWINADRKEREVYRRLFGKHLFGDEEHFPPAKHYTLEPLRREGRQALVCADVEGMENVILIQIRYLWPGALTETEIHSANDLFAVFEARDRKIPTKAILAGARFRVQFTDSRNTRTVDITPPGGAKYTRDDDGPVVEAWLRRRGFVVTGDDEHQPR